MSEVVLLNKTYDGFESWSDIGRDVDEMFEGKDVPGEGQGKVVVKIVYVPEGEDDPKEETCGLCNRRPCNGCPCR